MLIMVTTIDNLIKGTCVKGVDNHPYTNNGWEVKSSIDQPLMQVGEINAKTIHHDDDTHHAKEQE